MRKMGSCSVNRQCRLNHSGSARRRFCELILAKSSEEGKSRVIVVLTLSFTAFDARDFE